MIALNFSDVALYLLSKNADVSWVNIDNEGPLLFASRNINFQMVKALVEHGAEINVFSGGV